MSYPTSRLIQISLPVFVDRIAVRQILMAVVATLILISTLAAQDDGRTQATLERVPRHRPATLAVRRVTDAMAEGPNADLLRVAQMVLDLEADSFSQELIPVHLAIETQIRSTAESIRKYDLLENGLAESALQEAVADSSVQKLRHVTRRYYLTAAGYSACERLVATLLDAGEYGMASRLATQVLNEPAHRQRITPGFRALAEKVIPIGDEGRDPLRPKGNPDTTRFLQQVESHSDSLMPFAAEWNQMGGSPSHSRIIRGSPPIPIPAWSTDYVQSSRLSVTEDFLSEWEGTRKDYDQPFCPAAYPIVLRDSVVLRDLNGLRAVNPSNGKTSWITRLNYSPAAASSRTEMRIRRQMPFSAPGLPNLLGQNSTMGAISSDGRRIFAIDSVGADEELVEYENSGQFVRLLRNRLVAVHAAGERAGRIAWVNGGTVPQAFQKPPASAHLVFLGPPLPGATELLCVTEINDEVHLTALAPDTGVILWTQPLSVVERVEKFDLERYESACVPARADGIVVCPTNTGLLVAVDQVRMNLLWATYVDDVPEPRRAQIRGNTRQPAAGYPAYGSHLKIAGGRVVYLPPRSSHLHCLDQATGRIAWSVPRKDAEFVGVVSERHVLVVGRGGCRSLSLDNGQESWNLKIGVPAGQGVAIGSQYVLPIEGGRLAAIDMKTGKDHATDILRSNIRLGHLAADRNRVYSLSNRAIAAFPQIDPVLAAANADAAGGFNREVTLAEVAMMQGNLGDAADRLRRVLGNATSFGDRDRARHRLKDVLFAKVMRDADATYDDYETLDRLLDSPTDELRFLIAAAVSPAPPSGDLINRMGERAYGLPAGISAPAVPGNEDWMISPTVWCRLQLKQSQRDGFGGQVHRLLTDRKPQSERDQSIENVKRYVQVFDSDPQVVSARRLLASRMVAGQELHAVETLLLRNRGSDDVKVAADAATRLMQLWEECGFLNDAARQMNALDSEFADTRLINQQIGSEFVRQLDPSRPVRLAWKMNREPSWPVNHVEIRQSAALPSFTESIVPIPANQKSRRLFSERQEFAVSGRSFLANGQLELLTSAAESDDEYTLSIIDQRARLRRGSLAVPAKYRLSPTDRLFSGGHLLPIGIPGGLMGVSLIQLGDAEPAWKHLPAELVGRKAAAAPGPSGPGFASYLWRNRLFVVDPLDGSLLWHRVIPVSFAEASLELIGDGRALAVQVPEQGTVPSSDRKIYYEVFDTATGQKIATVRSGFIANQWQGYFGRHVIGFAELEEGRRLQVRDLLKDEPDISELVSDAARQPFLLPGGELFYLGSGGEIKIFDIVAGRKILSVQLGVEELQPIGAVRVQSDQFRYFVNFQRHTPTATTAHFNQPLNNSQIPGHAIRDDVYAFSRTTGELLWKRSLPNRTILQFPECHLPFLVMASVIKDRVNNAQQSLTIEVIDSATGATIGYRQDLTYDAFLTANYDGEQGRIFLKGLSTDVELRFGAAEGQSGVQ